ncbi:TetR family transcriptional regulator [Duganella sp. FT135W]|uniref:TetR family transcriptional regulator n=1 Tax=Duganella flavida TaxID=2692175 RepID=A0A6L8K8L6_9BURK|nr:TetR/AcrR family transcriptional regulator [Duganella flavida]MYM23849.1 TetR family transcriptional regulator [Duganella flavida]
MRKSKADTAETRKRIVAVASNMFLRRGLDATGVADIMQASGLTQGGFYRHFESKEQLIAEANEAAFRELHTMFERVTAAMAPQAALDLIVYRYLHQMQAEHPSRMCPLAALSSELRHAGPRVKVAAAEGYASLVRLIASLLQRLHVSEDAILAEAIVLCLVGAVSLSRMAEDAEAATAILGKAQASVTAMVRNATPVAATSVPSECAGSPAR